MKLYEYSVIMILVPVFQLAASTEPTEPDDSGFCQKDDEECDKYNPEVYHPITGAQPYK